MSGADAERLFFSMLRIRIVQETIAGKYHEQQMRCPVHLSIGQEAVAVGIIDALEKSDIVMSHHRAHSHYLAKGGNLKALISELYGKADGCSKGWGGSQHLIDLDVNFYGSASIIGGIVPIASGVAFAEKYKKSLNIVVVFFGDSVAEEGVLHETMNFSSVFGLPVLFVCENNLYSVHSHIRARQPDRPLFKIAEAHNIESYRVDGNNVFAVNELARMCAEQIRKEKRPFFIEALTYRIREHVGPNFDYELGYRSEKEVDMWRKKCPVEKLRKIVEREFGGEYVAETEMRIRQEVISAFEKAASSEFPSFEE